MPVGRLPVMTSVVLQHGVCKIVIKVAVNAMHVMSVALCIVVFNQESGALNQIMVPVSGLKSDRPYKVNPADTPAIKACGIRSSQLAANSPKVFMNQGHEQLTLLLRAARPSWISPVGDDGDQRAQPLAA